MGCIYSRHQPLENDNVYIEFESEIESEEYDYSDFFDDNISEDYQDVEISDSEKSTSPEIQINEREKRDHEEMESYLSQY